MKFLKIFAIAVAAFSVASCSDDDTSWNTESDVTVQMGEATFSTKEGRGMVSIPLTVSGERNGNIKVTLDVVSDFENPAKDEEHLYLTTKTIVIFPEDNTYDVEVSIVDDKDMNEARFCNVVIASAEGATIGAQSYTTIEIKDNDSEPYDRCAGEWILNTAKASQSGDLSFSRQYISLVSYDEGQAGYNKYYKVEGLVSGADELAFRAYFYYDEETKDGYITIANGQSGGTMEINSTFGEQSIYLMQLTSDGYLANTGNTVFYYDSEFSKMEVENEVEEGLIPEWGFLFNSGGWYILDSYMVTGMERP